MPELILFVYHMTALMYHIKWMMYFDSLGALSIVLQGTKILYIYIHIYIYISYNSSIKNISHYISLKLKSALNILLRASLRLYTAAIIPIYRCCGNLFNSTTVFSCQWLLMPHTICWIYRPISFAFRNDIICHQTTNNFIYLTCGLDHLLLISHYHML